MQDDHPELKKAVAAISQGKFERSFAIVLPLAREGMPLAQHFLGWHYHKGIGTVQDDDQAARWWMKAAIQGVVESQQGLGWAYANGRGVEEDPIEAYRWYSRAASGGDSEAKEGLMKAARRLSTEQIRSLEQEDREY